MSVLTTFFPLNCYSSLSAYSNSYSTSHSYFRTATCVWECYCVPRVHRRIICILSEYLYGHTVNGRERYRDKKKVSMRAPSFHTHTHECETLTNTDIIVVWKANQTRLPQRMMRLEWVLKTTTIASKFNVNATEYQNHLING